MNPFPLAFFVEHEFDRHTGPMEYHVEAVCDRRYYCLACFDAEGLTEREAEAVYRSSELSNDYYRETCCECGEEFE